MSTAVALDVVQRLISSEPTLAQLQKARAGRRAAMDKRLADAGLPPLRHLSRQCQQLFKLNPDDLGEPFTPRLVSKLMSGF